MSNEIIERIAKDLWDNYQSLPHVRYWSRMVCSCYDERRLDFESGVNEMDKTVYLGGFNCWSDDKERWDSHSVMGQFEKSPPDVEPEYVWANYDEGSYEGSALVVFKKDDIWYQAYGSHCSCYGLEGQWEPEVLDVPLHFQALNEGKSLISGYGSFESDGNLNTWLREMSK